MKRMEIRVGGSVREALGEFAAAWHRGARGERLAEVSTRLDFAAMGEMIAALTPRPEVKVARPARPTLMSLRDPGQREQDRFRPDAPPTTKI